MTSTSLLTTGPRPDDDPPGRIAVEGLTKRYADVVAVDDLSFTVEPGRVTGFLGPNGAGKTTTLRMLLGLVHPTAGTATVGGRRYVDLEEPTRVVGAVLEASSAHAASTGRNHLLAACLATRLPRSRADEVLELTGLVAAADRPFRGYSLGMRQRLGIATALLGDPPVLVLDEPANGLDPEGIRWMRTLLQGLAAEGRTVLVSSHLLGEMQALADDVVIVAAGRLVRQGSVDDVIAAMTSRARDALVHLRSPRAGALIEPLRRLGATVVLTRGDEVLVTGVVPSQVGDAALAAAVPLHGLYVDAPDLEDAFLDLTHDGAAIR